VFARSRSARLLREIRLVVTDPWEVFGTLALIATVLVVAVLMSNARHPRPQPTRIALVTATFAPSAQASIDGTPVPVAPAPAPSPSPAVQAIGPIVAPSHASTSTPRPSSRARPTATAQPTATAADNPPLAALILRAATGGLVTADASWSSDVDQTGIASYFFRFGDGVDVGPQIAAVATHTFAAAGTYTVTVIVTDSAGLWSSASGQVTVGP